MKNIAIFASGAGSNAKKIIEYFTDHDTIRVALIASNNTDAGVLKIAEDYDIPTAIINKENITDMEAVTEILDMHEIDLIALAGYMILMPAYLPELYPNLILNIHPALLPKYGGKGMFGAHVHEAVFAGKEKETGVTIHYVDPKYDEGEIIFQEKINIEDCKSPEEIAKKVLALEHANYARTIEQVIATSLETEAE